MFKFNMFIIFIRLRITFTLISYFIVSSFIFINIILFHIYKIKVLFIITNQSKEFLNYPLLHYKIIFYTQEF